MTRPIDIDELRRETARGGDRDEVRVTRRWLQAALAEGADTDHIRLSRGWLKALLADLEIRRAPPPLDVAPSAAWAIARDADGNAVGMTVNVGWP